MNLSHGILAEGRIAYKRTHYFPVTIVNYKTKTPTVYKGLNVRVRTQIASKLIRTASAECFIAEEQLAYHNMMFNYKYLITLLVAVHAAAENVDVQKKAALISPELKEANNDLKTSSSSYSHQYSDWGGTYPGGYGFSVTGVGTIDEKSGYDPSYNTLGGFDNSLRNSYTGYRNSGYNGITGYGSNRGSVGNKGYGEYNPNGYGQNGYSPIGYGSSVLDNTGGYLSNGGYGVGNGGYGGYGGNGGLNSYSGYNNPYYQGAGHLGYGYYNKKPGYGNIYDSRITPSIVTGYRGYARR